MRFAPVLLLVALATVALSVEGHRKHAKKRTFKWSKSLNTKFDKQLGLAFQKYNKGPYREWFGPVSFNLKKMKGRGKLGRYDIIYPDGSFGIFSYIKGKKGKKNIVTLHYDHYKKGRIVLSKEEVKRWKKHRPKQIFKIMKKFVKHIRLSERKRLGLLGKKGRYLFIIRNKMSFKLKKVKGKRALYCRNRIYINKKMKDTFSKVFDLESRSSEEVIRLLAQYRLLVQSRNVQQYFELMRQVKSSGEAVKQNTLVINEGNTGTGSGNGITSTNTITSSSTTTSYKRSFDFHTSLVDGKLTLIATCIIKKNGQVVDTINKSYKILDTNGADAIMEEFKNNECQMPEPRIQN